MEQFKDEIYSDTKIYNIDLQATGYTAYLNTPSVNEFVEALASVILKEYEEIIRLNQPFSLEFDEATSNALQSKMIVIMKTLDS